MHLDLEQQQRMLHGELDDTARAQCLAHLAGCDECRQRLDDARRDEQEILGLLERADTPPPPADIHRVLALAGTVQRAWLRRAAVITLVIVAAGAAWAAPGSPLRRWTGRVTRPFAPQEAPAPEAPQAGTPDVSASGIVVEPGARFRIQFAAISPGTRIEVSLGDGRGLAVRATGGTASFVTDAAGLTVRADSGVTVFAIELPRRAPWIAIDAGRQRLLLLRERRVTASVSADSLGVFRFSGALP